MTRAKQDKEHKETVGGRLAGARVRASLTQLDVAKLCEVTKATVSGWEIGKNYPDLGQLARLMRLYKVSPDEILFGETALSPRAMGIAQRLDKIEDPRLKRWAFAACESTVVNAEENLGGQTPEVVERQEQAPGLPSPRLVRDS